MFRPDKIIFHCAETRTDQDFSVETVRKWYTDPKPIGRGWSDIGYHYYIKLDGSVHIGRSLSRSGAHTFGVNLTSIGACFEGGLNPDGSQWDKPTDAQIKSAKELINELKQSYGIDFSIHGHYEFSETKWCPGFDVCLLVE